MKVSIMLCLTLFTASANGAFFSGADLFQWLENDMNGVQSYEGGMGKGYLLGAMDMLASSLPPTVCYPKNTGISAYQVKSVVYEYMLNHPDSTQMKPDKLVYQALTQHWPCK
jgi:hypothetical protein